MIKIYLAIPYTGMEKSSYEQANRATAELLKLGFNVFSPITHSHSLTKYKVPGTWDFWSQIDYQFIDWADVILVLIPKEGSAKVLQSTGVQAEIEYVKEKGKSYIYIHEHDIGEKLKDYIQNVNTVDKNVYEHESFTV